MKRNIIKTSKAPAPVGTYSQGAGFENIIFTAGQIPIDPASGEFLNDDIKSATRQVLKNVIAVVEAGGGTKDILLKLTVFMKDLNDFTAVNDVFGEFFPDTAPARSAVQVSVLPKDAIIEIEGIAHTSK